MNELPRTMAEIEAGMARGLHVGAQLYVSRDGRTVCDAAVGLARPATADRAAIPMTPDTITLWLSAGKPLTAVAIAQLWERGLIRLDDPVAAHVPEFAAHGKERITIRHILTHTAPLRLAATGWPDATWGQMITRICATRPEPNWTPGRTAGYSAHVTWYVLAEVVQRLSGQMLAGYLREHVFGPCGMADSFIAMTAEEQAEYAGRTAVTQTTEKGAPADLGTETARALSVPRPSGSARGPARELGRFYEALLVGLRGKGAGVLGTQTIEAMTARHRVNTMDKTFNAVIDWGLGLIVNSLHYGREDTPYQYGAHASARTFGHSGNQSTVGFADPECGLVVALVFNGLAGEKEHQPRVRGVLGTLYEEMGLDSALGS